MAWLVANWPYCVRMAQSTAHKRRQSLVALALSAGHDLGTVIDTQDDFVLGVDVVFAPVSQWDLHGQDLRDLLDLPDPDQPDDSPAADVANWQHVTAPPDDPVITLTAPGAPQAHTHATLEVARVYLAA